jgi:hypothetical protein
MLESLSHKSHRFSLIISSGLLQVVGLYTKLGFVGDP